MEIKAAYAEGDLAGVDRASNPSPAFHLKGLSRRSYGLDISLKWIAKRGQSDEIRARDLVLDQSSAVAPERRGDGE